MRHQYIERSTGRVHTERLYGDRVVRALYAAKREDGPKLFRALTGARMSTLLGFVNYDFPMTSRLCRGARFLKACGVDLTECLDFPESYKTLRDVFERRIRYWEHRPMPGAADVVVSPADARVLVGSLEEASSLFLKGKFFHFDELLGLDKGCWLKAFRNGDFAVFRLTPDKYHYNHTPVAGAVVDFYEIAGRFHSCNPGAVVAVATPYSKNKRVVTVIDTDVPGGTGVGLVAMIEVVALMIGEVVQCYSEERYDAPQSVEVGLFVKKGMPKSLYRPGSSTDVLLFQKGRVRFAEDLVANLGRAGVESRFAAGFGRPLVETDVAVRSLIAAAAPAT